MIISLCGNRILQNIILFTLFVLPTIVKTEDIEHKILDLYFNTSTNRFYFEEGVPSITYTNQQLFSSQKHYEFIPRFFNLEVAPLDEDNVYIFLDADDDVLFYFTGEVFPSFPSYAVGLQNLTMTKCVEDSLCENLDCKTVPVMGNNEQLQKIAVYLAWKKENGMVKLLLQHNNTVLFCQDNNNIVDFERISMRGSTQQPITLTANYPFAFTSKADETLVSKNFTINSNEALYFYTFLCDACTINVSLICNNYTNNIVTYSRKGWQEIKLDGPNSNDSTCYVTATTLLSENSGYDGSNTLWAFTKNGFLLERNTTTKTSGSGKPANTSFLFIILIAILFVHF